MNRRCSRVIRQSVDELTTAVWLSQLNRRRRVGFFPSSPSPLPILLNSESTLHAQSTGTNATRVAYEPLPHTRACVHAHSRFVCLCFCACLRVHVRLVTTVQCSPVTDAPLICYNSTHTCTRNAVQRLIHNTRIHTNIHTHTRHSLIHTFKRRACAPGLLHANNANQSTIMLQLQDSNR